MRKTFEKGLTYCKQYVIIIAERGGHKLSRRKKKDGNQTDRLTSKINLVAAILNLVTVVLIVLERLLE